MPRYQALRTRQHPDGPWLVFFSASATEISSWSGIPQKKELGRVETTGFQRQENLKRISQIAEFCSDSRNTIQNPLLGAIRTTEGSHVIFHPEKDDPINALSQHGVIEIESASYEDMGLLDLLRLVKASLEQRVPALREREVPPSKVADLREAASQEGLSLPDTEIEPEELDEEQDGEPAEAALFEEESHILDFWDEIAGRIALLQELTAADSAYDPESLLGYSKDAMSSFLRPVIIVDGQHRLRGAKDATRQRIDNDDDLQTKIAQRIEEGATAKEAHDGVASLIARHLPVSLLMEDNPAEHVFQFVVVNQKATPISRPLLGTIISTTLSNEELETVGARLENAGIPLDDSRAIASLSRDPKSPFRDLVQRGLASDPSSEVLNWSVFGGLVRIFRELSGGKLFGQRNDYADVWKRQYLDDSAICSDYEDAGYEDAFAYWRDLNGPWREVFIAFWTEIRDYFATTTDQEAYNYWGRPRTSNLFNKISLTILAADFFQFLCERDIHITSADVIPSLVEKWLSDVNKTYFSRDWRLSGVKKDSTGIRKQWAQLWAEYRKDPSRLPRLELYSHPVP